MLIRLAKLIFDIFTQDSFYCYCTNALVQYQCRTIISRTVPVHRLGEELAVWVRLKEDAIGSGLTEEEVSCISCPADTDVKLNLLKIYCR